MTQQDIIDELNRMVIGYNINWDMIKYDADKAIMKINAHLGAEYPMMSEILLSPRHRYTIPYKHTELPIFPERYILTVVIPYIATEILARDEEFTTIYNKYAMDFENGLFDMFQNEFNKVIPVFRQDPDVGVFFSQDSKEYDKHKRRDKELPDIRYNVYYHFNQEWADMEPFTIDPNKYKYGANLIIKEPSIKEFIKDIYAYEFKGWALSPDSTVVYQPDNEYECIKSDIHFYAVWHEECVLDITSTGILSIVDKYFDKVIELNIPPIVKGVRVNAIPSFFDTRLKGTEHVGAAKLTSVTLPRTNLTISSFAFMSRNITNFILPSYDYLRDYPEVTIELSAIYLCNVDYLYIPYSVVTIEELGITGVDKIQCEIEKQPSKWHLNWTDEDTLDKVDWGVFNG